MTSGCQCTISRRYHTCLAQMFIDPQTLVQTIIGVVFIFLLSDSHLLFFLKRFTHSLLPSLLIPSSFPLFSFSSIPLLFYFFHSLTLPTTHPHGSNSLSGLSHSLQASRQSLLRLEQKTQQLQTALYRAGMKHVSH